MDKPTKPTNLMPRSFGGVKNNFSANLQSSGYEDGIPAIYGGDNLNYQLDATGKELDYCEKICDFIKDLPIGKIITTDSNNKLIYGEIDCADRALGNLDTNGNNRLHALKGYKDAGELLTDAEGLAAVHGYYHSTYNSTKFTSNNPPTVTDDGIASGFTGSIYYNLVNAPDLTTYSSWAYTVPFKFTSTIGNVGFFSIGGVNAKTGVTYNGGTFTATIFTASNTTITITLNYTLSTLIDYILRLKFTGTAYVLTLFDKDYNVLASNEIASTATIFTNSSTEMRVGLRQSGTYLANGQIDLKGVEVIGDGVPVFNGNINGSDSYTIDGNTVTIPYNISKTGSKVANSAYRTQVSAVYNAYGCAPYYTVSDTDFTLPQGEIYGMLAQPFVYIDQTDNANRVSTATSISTHNITTTVRSLLPDNLFTYECFFYYRIGRSDNSNVETVYSIYVDGNTIAYDQIDDASQGATYCGGQFMAIIKPNCTIESNIAGVALASHDLYLVGYRKIN